MGLKSSIEWTDATWNPTTGCKKISPGCDNCYAASLAARLKRMGNPRYQKDGPDGPGFGLTLHHDKLTEPLRWRTPRRVFVDSMSDLFHPGIPVTFTRRVFESMLATPHHQYQVLTKRPKRMARFVREFLKSSGGILPENIWLGTSIESDAWAWRAVALREVPAQIRFLSLEPLLGPVPSLEFEGIDWVIVGGESGRHSRAIEIEWIRGIRDRCLASRIPFFFKQWGGRTSKAGGRLLDGSTWDQFPKVPPVMRHRLTDRYVNPGTVPRWVTVTPPRAE